MMSSPTNPRPLTKPRLLIGEGKEEVVFFESLLSDLKVTDVQVEEYSGKTKLPLFLQEFRKRPGHQNVVSLAVTRDADADVQQAFQSVCGSLTNAGLSTPARPGQIAQGAPRIGVYLLPDNQNPGMLEDLCLSSVLSDGAMSCVDDYFACVLQRGKRQPSNMAKARVHAWLASQVVPDRRLGEAATAGIWPWSSPPFTPLAQFLQSF